jgi:hypothetical protein
MIFLNMAIPLIAIVLLLIFFRKKVTLWEYAIVLGIPLIVIFICKFISITSQVNTHEIWNAHITEVKYYECWETWVHETCSRQVSYGTDSKGNTQYRTEYYDCSHCDFHPEHYDAYDNLGNEHNVSAAQFEQYCKLWNNRTFVPLHRNINYHWSCGRDGNMYQTVYDNNFDHTVPTVSQHTYVNKVKCSRSVFNFQEVSKEDKIAYGLYDYPSLNEWNYNPIVGYNNPNASLRLQRYNSILGAYKKVHMLIMVFKGKAYTSALMEEAYLKGGNKNEFILCIGTKDSLIAWTKVISWTDKTECKIRVEREVKELSKLDMVKTVDIMANEVKIGFVKKSFKDFDYITVEPTDTAVFITCILTILITIGLCIYVVNNEIDLE